MNLPDTERHRTRFPDIGKLRGVWLVAGLLLVLACDESPTGPDRFAPEERGDGWLLSTPAAQGLDERILSDGFTELSRLPYAYSLLVVRHDHIVAEQYFGRHTHDVSMDMRSVSKSVLSAITGISLERGYLDSLDQRIAGFFPEIIDSTLDPRISDITIRHLLTMRAGFPEDQQTYFEVYLSSDWVRATLHLPMLYDPGERMVYNTFETHLLSVILTRASGRNTFDLIQQDLCDPLGIQIRWWERDPQGYYFGGNGMHFLSRDIARFGLLFLRGGYLRGKQIVPRSWVDSSLADHTGYSGKTWGDLQNYNYGYLWWMGELNGHRVQFGLGYGGQFVVLVPDTDMVVVATADPELDWTIADEHERTILHIIGTFVIGSAAGSAG